MIIQMVVIKFLLSLLKNIFCQEWKIENYNIEIDEKNVIIHQWMTQLNNMMKSEKYQPDKVMIIKQAVY